MKFAKSSMLRSNVFKSEHKILEHKQMHLHLPIGSPLFKKKELIHSYVETNRIQIYTPRLSIGRNLTRP